MPKILCKLKRRRSLIQQSIVTTLKYNTETDVQSDQRSVYLIFDRGSKPLRECSDRRNVRSRIKVEALLRPGVVAQSAPRPEALNPGAGRRERARETMKRITKRRQFMFRQQGIVSALYRL